MTRCDIGTGGGWGSGEEKTAYIDRHWMGAGEKGRSKTNYSSHILFPTKLCYDLQCLKGIAVLFGFHQRIFFNESSKKSQCRWSQLLLQPLDIHTIHLDPLPTFCSSHNLLLSHADHTNGNMSLQLISNRNVASKLWIYRIFAPTNVSVSLQFLHHFSSDF